MLGDLANARSLDFARDDNLLEDDSFFVVTGFRG